MNKKQIVKPKLFVYY